MPAPADAVSAAFAALEVGERFRFTPTFSEADVSLFVGITGDFNCGLSGTLSGGGTEGQSSWGQGGSSRGYGGRT